ncbi:hypothetical protein RSOLAG22IIIB_11343 [Rhizoctonia solani]|uniref:Uncharacterized protein n=1 Tax=Rhizoctonia solani TaxID=456999 RepID=A0A0K6G7J7_9AGAM|nr:hypothetical protein RSOLAG22IIIB_11343 [Rhizoctonia solani]
MTKRKLASGYEISSDESSNELKAPPPKKSKQFQPPRLSLSTSNVNKTKTHTFNFPTPSTNATPSTAQPKAVTDASQSRAGGSTSMPTPPDRPGVPRAPIPSLSDDEAAVSPTVAKGKNRAPAPVVLEGESSSDEKDQVPHTSIPSGSGAGSSRRLLEQHMNEMSTQLQSIDAQAKQNHREIKEEFGTLKQSIEELRVLFITKAVPSNPTDDKPAAQPVSASGKRMTNPRPTKEFSDLVIKVATEYRSRVGHKETGNARHARKAWDDVTMLNGKPAPHPSFVDSNGNDDYFPKAFADPITGYRQPFPNYDKPMDQQTAWVPTVYERFVSTVPHDNGSVSTMLRGLSDEQILILIHDGPFSTARGNWGKRGKLGNKDEQNSHARREKRSERICEARSLRREEVPALMGAEWDWVYHPGMMSRHVSDDEGNITVERNEGRAQWLTNFYEANDLASRRRSVKPNVVLVAPSIPKLRTRRGGKVTKKLLPIGLCGFSKKFRRENSELFESSEDLLNTRLSTPPDISAFLAKYPKVDEPELEPNTVGLDGEAGDDLREVGAFNTGVEDEGEDADTEEDLEEREPGQPKKLEEPKEPDEPKELDESQTVRQRGPRPKAVGTASLDDHVIDPTLRSTPPAPGAQAQHPVPVPASPPAPAPALALAPAPNVSRAPSIDPPVMRDSWGNPVGTDMPPPPPLQEPDKLNAAPGGVESEGQSKPKRKYTKKKVQPEASANETQGEQEEVIPKKRGRPQGSKNKPKEHAPPGESEAGPPTRKRGPGRPRKVAE